MKIRQTHIIGLFLLLATFQSAAFDLNELVEKARSTVRDAAVISKVIETIDIHKENETDKRDVRKTKSINQNSNQKKIIYRIQEQLNRLGYNTGRPDGMLGNKTKKAIRGFQVKKKLRSNGMPSEELLNMLMAEKASVSVASNSERKNNYRSKEPTKRNSQASSQNSSRSSKDIKAFSKTELELIKEKVATEIRFGSYRKHYKISQVSTTHPYLRTKGVAKVEPSTVSGDLVINVNNILYKITLMPPSSAKDNMKTISYSDEMVQLRDERKNEKKKHVLARNTYEEKRLIEKNKKERGLPYKTDGELLEERYHEDVKMYEKKLVDIEKREWWSGYGNAEKYASLQLEEAKEKYMKVRIANREEARQKARKNRVISDISASPNVDHQFGMDFPRLVEDDIDNKHQKASIMDAIIISYVKTSNEICKGNTINKPIEEKYKEKEYKGTDYTTNTAHYDVTHKIRYIDKELYEIYKKSLKQYENNIMHLVLNKNYSAAKKLKNLQVAANKDMDKFYSEWPCSSSAMKKLQKSIIKYYQIYQ